MPFRLIKSTFNRMSSMPLQVTTSLALTLALVGTVTAPTVADAQSGRPAVIQRPNAATPPAPSAGQDTAQDTAAERPTRRQPAAQPAQRQGPPVLSPEDINPDGGAIGNNFPENFDPFNPPRNLRVNIDFDQADLSDVVMWISALTGQNFIIADTISSSKKITIISPQPVSVGEAYRAFIAALSMNGLTIVPFGRFLKIVEASEAAREPNRISTQRGQIAYDDRMVTHIHQIEHVSLDTINPVIEALKTEAASIVQYAPTNTLIITETGTNLRRLLDVIERLDVPSGQERINLYQVQYAVAGELKEILLELFEAEDDSNPTPSPTPRRRRRGEPEPEETSEDSASPASVSVSQIISDERTNQLIIISNERSFQRMMGIISELDVPIPGEGQIHVISLENANATELASTLQSLTQSIEQQRDEAAGGAAARRAAAAEGESGGDQGAVSATLSGEVSITADEATNSLVVTASLRDFLTLERVIGQLDRRREQVYVEAVVMEVSLDRDSRFGLWLHGGSPVDFASSSESGALGVRTGFSDQNSLSGIAALASPGVLQGLAVGFQGPSLEIGGVSLPSFGAILQALETDSDVNVLSTPHILTMDNEEAEIVVGENIPIPTSLASGGGLGSLGSLGGLLGSNSGADASSLLGLGGLGALGGLGGQINIQRQDVALTLRIRPQINSSDYVRLEIEQQIDDVQDTDGEYGPTTTTRQIRTVVAVEDQQTVVLGGLMRDTETRSVSKVPVLGDIPILGNLFRRTSSRTVKSNLLLLLTPYIIRDPSDFQEIFRRKMEEREEFIAYFGRRDQDYVRSVDYARKNGPMESMMQTIVAAQDDEEQRRRAYGTDNDEEALNLNRDEPIRIDITGTGETVIEDPAEDAAE